MRAWVIYNPVAGPRDMHGEIVQVVDYLQHQGWQVQAQETRCPGDAIRYARQAVESGCRLVFAAGGDGTLNEVVNGIAGSDAAVSALPIGTGNVWAKEIGLPVSTPLHPHRLLDSVRAVEDGFVYTVDAGQANGRYFLLWAGIGFDARIVEEVEPQFETKRRWGFLAFAVTGVVVAASFVGTRASVTIDERTFRQRVLLVLVSNTQRYGGGLLRVAPQARLDDGQLDVYIFEGEGPFSTVRHAMGVLTGRYLHDPEVSYHRICNLKIETSKPMPVHVDGVSIGETPLEIRLAPRSIKVVVPCKVPYNLFADATAEGIPFQQFIAK